MGGGGGGGDWQGFRYEGGKEERKGFFVKNGHWRSFGGFERVTGRDREA